MHAGVKQVPRENFTSMTQASTYSKEPSYLAIAVTPVSAVLLIFLLRVYTRIRLLRFFAIDDGFMLGAVMVLVGALAVFLDGFPADNGKNGEDLTAQEAQSIGLHLWTFASLTTVSVSFTKISIVVFLLRAVKRIVYRRVLYLKLAIISATGLAWFASIVLQCVPTAAAWGMERVVGARCIPNSTFTYLILFYNAINAATSLTFALLPVSVAWSSQVTVRTTFSLVPRAVILTLGLISTTAATIRIFLIYSQRNTLGPSMSHSAQICIWGVVEMSSGTTAACLPPLKPLLATVSTLLSYLSPTRRAASTKPSPPRNDSESPPPSPYAQSYSTPTFLSLPRPKPNRFHDRASDLDFDLYDAPVQRSPTHSRNPSNLTVFSNFASNFTVPPFDRELETTLSTVPIRSRGEVNSDGLKSGYAVSVTSGCGSGDTCEGSEEERTVRRVGSEDSCGAVVGGNMRTTEVTIGG